MIRAATLQDGDAVLDLIEPIVREGGASMLPMDWSREELLAFWFAPGHEVFVAEDGEIVGTYFLCRGHGNLAKCGYATADDGRCKGVARAMYEHSVVHAKELGFGEMRFNFVTA